MEMPEMNGIEVLREIKKGGFPVRVIMFSSQTKSGAELALTALREGADDVVAKPSGQGLSVDTATDTIRSVLVPKILQFAQSKSSSLSESYQPIPGQQPSQVPQEVAKSAQPSIKKDLSKFLPSVVVIGSSTGGPAALEHIFKTLRAPLSVPIIIVQHMPPVFTEILAKRLGEVSGIPSDEAKGGETLEANHIYIAPGNFHLVVQGTSQKPMLSTNQSPQRNSVRPSVDPLFESASLVYGAKCLGLILTGMGEDGLAGARQVRRHGGVIMIQDRESCVVFGMPGAIFRSGDYDQVGNLDAISKQLNQLIRGTPTAQ
jgi:two-component system chemotaxis response regulator CheB